MGFTWRNEPIGVVDHREVWPDDDFPLRPELVQFEFDKKDDQMGRRFRPRHRRVVDIQLFSASKLICR